MSSRRFIDRLTLRSRLTVWVVGFSTLINVSVGVVFYLYQSRSINSFFNENLERCSEGMISSVASETPGIDATRLTALAIEQSQYAMFSGFVLTVFDADGRVVATTRERPPRVAVDKAVLSRVAAARSVELGRVPADLVREFDPGAAWARVIYRGFQGRDGKSYVLLARTADSFAEHMLGLVGLALLVVLPAGVVVSAVSGWYIAGLAVRPLEEVARSAEGLSPQSIDRPLSVRTTSPETVRLEHELNSARERISRAFAAQERFMSNVSHELKTPVAVVMAEAQTIDSRQADPEVKAFVRSVCEEMRRLGSMIDSFLLLTRVREGRSLTQSRPCPVNDLVMESVGHCLSMAVQYGVRLDPRLCESAEEVRVRGDPSLLRTMLDNLVRNAVRFSPHGSAIHISAAVEGGEEGVPGEVVLRVRDHGQGIPASIIDGIFDRFVQAPDEHRHGRGQGLGLEIAQGIAELHGGGITVRNCAAESGANGAVDGCEFTVRLPRASADGPAPEAASGEPVGAPGRMS